MELEYDKPFEVTKKTQAFIDRWEFIFYELRLDVLFGNIKAISMLIHPELNHVISSWGGERIQIKCVGYRKYCVSKV